MFDPSSFSIPSSTLNSSQFRVLRSFPCGTTMPKMTMRLLSWPCVLISAVNGLWPAPHHFHHGSSVIWVSSDIRMEYEPLRASMPLLQRLCDKGQLHLMLAFLGFYQDTDPDHQCLQDQIWESKPETTVARSKRLRFRLQPCLKTRSWVSDMKTASEHCTPEVPPQRFKFRAGH